MFRIYRSCRLDGTTSEPIYARDGVTVIGYTIHEQLNPLETREDWQRYWDNYFKKPEEK